MIISCLKVDGQTLFQDLSYCCIVLQWCNSGNIYPVGLAPRDTIVHGVKSFVNCPDSTDERYK